MHRILTALTRGSRFRTKSRLPSQENPDWLDWAALKKKRLQHLIAGYKFQMIEVTGDMTDIINLFVRTNSTGRALTSAEEQHARYHKSDFLLRP
jgi:hypothetical protein